MPFGRPWSLKFGRGQGAQPWLDATRLALAARAQCSQPTLQAILLAGRPRRVDIALLLKQKCFPSLASRQDPCRCLTGMLARRRHCIQLNARECQKRRRAKASICRLQKYDRSAGPLPVGDGRSWFRIAARRRAVAILFIQWREITSPRRSRKLEHCKEVELVVDPKAPLKWSGSTVLGPGRLQCDRHVDHHQSYCPSLCFPLQVCVVLVSDDGRCDVLDFGGRARQEREGQVGSVDVRSRLDGECRIPASVGQGWRWRLAGGVSQLEGREAPRVKTDRTKEGASDESCPSR